MHSLVTLTAILALGQAASADEMFEAKIRPVLVESCFKCHGGTKVSNGLRVDSRPGLVKGGKNGPALVLGYQHRDLQMPPGGKLPDHVVADFTAWITQGAPWPTTSKSAFKTQAHWAFQPITNPAPPQDSTGWAVHPIDRFILAKLRGQGLKPVEGADARTLLRRLAFDLIGLAPTPENLEAFTSAWDAAGAKHEQLLAEAVDRLLASPRYGERWGQHWMDVVRYADTAGDNADYPIPEIHRYRDNIIDAFNADKPFNQFVEEQLGGDLMKDGAGTSDNTTTPSVRVRFHSTGGKNYARGEALLIYRPQRLDATKITFAWTDDKGDQQASHTFVAAAKETPWNIAAGRSVQTRWVEFEAVGDVK